MICKYYGICGGCSLQHLSYENQLKFKKEKLKQIFGFEIPIIKNPKPFGYRSRMDFVYAFNKIGLRKRRNWRKVVDIDECPLMSDKANNLLKIIREKIKKFNIEGYNYIEHKGFVRYFVIRETKKEIMLNIVVAKYNKEYKKRLIPLINSLLPYVDSLNILLNDTLSDVSFGEVVDNFKKEYIIEQYDGIKLKVYPNCFLQSNRRIALMLYKEITKECFGKCADLYSGVGSIALFIARNGKIDYVVGVENNEENIKAFIENIEINKMKDKVKIYAGNVREFLNDAIKQNKNYDVIISDPPRAGMGKKVSKKLLELMPEKLLLVSCNPYSLKQDYEIFKKSYNLSKAIAFDMFSQTDHIEILFILERKN